jgi:murein L,D-transpeptidase YafK
MKTAKIISILAIIFLANTSFKKLIGKDDFYIVVSKSSYTMTIYDAENNFVVSYPATFGSKDLSDKMFEGDRKTPEGTFHIASKRVHPKWCRFMALDYPTAESYQKFYERKAAGEIPANAKIGGGIGIHGTWPTEDWAVDEHQGWTQGCVSTKNTYVNEIYSQLPVGTRVEILP